MASMPINVQTKNCIQIDRGAIIFWSPKESKRKPSTKVQIIDVLALQVATGYIRDPRGRLLLEAEPTVTSGRTWTMAKAAQLIRNDARPSRWVALQFDKSAWGLFWAGGGLHRCRELLTDRLNNSDGCTDLVPATPEALLIRLLELEHYEQSLEKKKKTVLPVIGPWNSEQINPWKLAAWTSLAWLAVVCLTVSGFLVVLQRQDQKLELLLQRTNSLN